MPLESTSAIVLKSFPYGDTSKIARIYTRDFGKLSIIGKGVMSSKALQGSYFEPINCINLNFYYSPKKQLQIFSKAEFNYALISIKNDMKKLSYGFAIMELIDRTVTGQEPNKELYFLTEAVLKAIDKSSGNLNRIFWYFEIKLLSILGLRPHLSNCPQCNKKLYSAFFSLIYGELVCGKCISGSSSKLSAGTINIIKILSTSNLDDLSSIECSPLERKEFGHFIKKYLEYHVEGLHHIRSLRVMESILR
ncbi:MAG: DNA repair protein RecO [Candidatus Marinimicrobia bacterium]|nr:DNA repair protein RecO [Candidatus Neomarinimicrobiota bacterium]|tara:strand:- start:21887 stop:22636 length:750 start_codon:yes stop_codon:yes gene_type:complete